MEREKQSWIAKKTRIDGDKNKIETCKLCRVKRAWEEIWGNYFIKKERINVKEVEFK